MVSAVLRRIAVPLALIGLIALAGVSLNRIYNGALLLQLVAGAAAAAVLLSAALRRVPSWVVAPLSVATLAGYALYAVQLSARAGAIDGDLPTLAADASRNAVPRLLTALIPIEPQPDTVLAPVVLAWLTGFAAAELAERARRPGLALIPPTLLYAGALVLVGPNAGVVAWQPLAFAALAATALVAGGARSGVRDLPGVSRGQAVALRLRTAGGLTVGLVAVLAVVALAAPFVANAVDRSPADPRRYVEPPNLDVLDQNPLIRVAAWAANPEQPLLEVDLLRGAAPAEPTQTPSPTPAVTPSGSDVVVVPNDDQTTEAEDPAGELAAYDTRLRLAVLEEWDGVTWHLSGRYQGAGRVLPAAADPPGLGDTEPVAPPKEIEERITIGELQGRLMPAIAAPHRVDGVRVAYDQASGTLLRSEPFTPGVSYTVTSVSRSLDYNVLPGAEVPSGPSVARLLAVGDTVPADLSTLAEKIVAGEGSPYLKALALEAFLADHYRFAGDAPSGHSYPNLRFFLFDPPRNGGQRGTSEQFAAAFATLGRLVGLPTRVVVGFRTPAGGGTVTAGDGLAWPEVLFSGVGWVAFDPMPDPKAPPRDLEEEFLPKPSPSSTPPPSTAPPLTETFEPTTPTPSGAASAPAPGLAVAVIAGGVGGGVLVLLVVFLIVIAFLRWLLQRGRRRGTPPERVLGAWDEVLDALQLAGQPAPAHLAAGEVARHAAEVVGSAPAGRHTRRPRPAAPALDDLAAKVNAVGFGGGLPMTGPDELSAHTATVQAVEYTRALRSRRSWWRRALWRVDPRPLRRR